MLTLLALPTVLQDATNVFTASLEVPESGHPKPD